MNIPSPRSRKHARIEIVPLIDIIFFLLATFVMVSLSMVKNHGIKVSLPAAATGEEQKENEYTAISVNEAGAIFFNDDEVTIEELANRVTQLKQQVADPRVFVKGDKGADFGIAVAVLDEVRKAGITKIAIETKPKS